MDDDFKKICDYDIQTFDGYIGRYLDQMKFIAKDYEKPLLEAIEKLNDLLADPSVRSRYMGFAASVLDLSKIVKRDDDFDYALIIFRYVVVRHIFDVLKGIWKATKETHPAFADSIKRLKSFIKAEDVQNWTSLVQRIRPCDRKDIPYVAEEWILVKMLLLMVIPTLCTKDLAEDLAEDLSEDQARERVSFELAKSREIWSYILQLDNVVQQG